MGQGVDDLAAADWRPRSSTSPCRRWTSSWATPTCARSTAGTFGSLSTRQFGPVLRRAAAEAKAVLIADRRRAPAGAGRRSSPSTPAPSCTGPIARSGVTYGQLTEGKRIERTARVPADARAASAFTIVGTDAPRRDALEKVTGKAKYAGDIVPPGALHARIVRPPAHGATLATVDTSAAEKVPGVRVVRDGDLVAVLHAHRDEADKALRLDEGDVHAVAVDPHRRDDFRSHREGRAALATRARERRRSRRRREARHAGVRRDVPAKATSRTRRWRPHSAVAAVENGKVTVWASTQTPFPLKSQIAQALESPAREGARDHAVRRRRLRRQERVASRRIEAARLAIAAGVPVRVRLEPRGGVLLRHVRPGRRAHHPLRPRRGQAGSSSGTTRSSARATAAPSISTTSRTTARSCAAAGKAPRPACIRSRSARGARRAPTPTRSPANRRSTSWRRRPASIRSSSGCSNLDGRAHASGVLRSRGQAVRLDAEGRPERPRLRRRDAAPTPAPTSPTWPK